MCCKVLDYKDNLNFERRFEMRKFLTIPLVVLLVALCLTSASQAYELSMNPEGNIFVAPNTEIELTVNCDTGGENGFWEGYLCIRVGSAASFTSATVLPAAGDGGSAELYTDEAATWGIAYTLTVEDTAGANTAGEQFRFTINAGNGGSFIWLDYNPDEFKVDPMPLTINMIPEPMTFMLFGLGVTIVARLKRRK